jgi:hypothetical protein
MGRGKPKAGTAALPAMVRQARHEVQAVEKESLILVEG